MRRLAVTAVLLLLPAGPVLADCRALDFGRFPLDSARFPVTRDCRTQGECEFQGGDGVRYLAAAFEPKTPPRIVRKTIDTEWKAAPFGLRRGAPVAAVRAKLARAGISATAVRTHDGRPGISAACAVRGVDFHFDALFTADGALNGLTAGVATPND